jgi:ATP-dependent RNA helicase DDX59
MARPSCTLADADEEDRWPAPGEPACVVCGRYGAYVCDTTEADVCSRVCKTRNLAAIAAHDAGPYRFCPPATAPGWASAARAAHGIQVGGEDVPAPLASFAALQLPRAVAGNLATLGYATPTPVQRQVLPTALLGRDVLVGAATGTGKTLAYALAVVCALWQDSGGDGPRALVLVPTRELAAQTEATLQRLMAGLPSMRTARVTGGDPTPPQLHRLRRGADVLVATPGRLAALSRDHPDVAAAAMRTVRLVVLDEVDELMRRGFEPAVRSVLARAATPRQTLALSATMPPAAEQLARALLIRPVLVAVRHAATTTGAAHNVFHTVLWVEERVRDGRPW